MSVGAEGGADATKEVWPSQSRPLSYDRVTLVVDGTHFVVDPAVFSTHPDTVLGRYWTHKHMLVFQYNYLTFF